MTDPDTGKAVAIARGLRIVFSRLRRQLREPSPADDLSGPQLVVLTQLGKGGPASASQLAAREAMTNQSMGATVASLESLGLLERSPDPSDGRRQVLSLTASGRERFAGDRAAKEERFARLLASYPEADLDTLLRAVELLEEISLK